MLKEWLETEPHLPHDYGKYCSNSLTLFGWITAYLKFRGKNYCNCKRFGAKKGTK
jgi:hypothetical protein